MSDEQENDGTEPQTGSKPPWQPPKDEDDFNRIIQARLARQGAKYADYDDLKAKAAKFDESEQAKQTQAQKDAGVIADLKAQLTASTETALRNEVAAAKGVPAANLSGKTREELEASADQLITWKGSDTRKAPPTPGNGPDIRQDGELSATDIVNAALKR